MSSARRPGGRCRCVWAHDAAVPTRLQPPDRVPGVAPEGPDEAPHQAAGLIPTFVRAFSDPRSQRERSSSRYAWHPLRRTAMTARPALASALATHGRMRSEERRVGHEYSAGWAPTDG